MSKAQNIQAEIKALELDARSAIEWAKAGKVEDWVHRYLNSGTGGSTNAFFSERLKDTQRWWNGPLEIELDRLAPAVGPEPGMEYQVDEDPWIERTTALASSFTDLGSLPPLIAEYRAGILSLRDGNTRHAAMKSIGWPTCWVILWYNSEEDYRRHSAALLD